MLNRPKECEGCPLNNIAEGFSQPEGTGSIPLLIVGESLGYNEMLEGLPFRPNAPAGSILHRIIQDRAKFSRSQLLFWNICGCHPPGDKLANTSYEYEASQHCRVHFDRVVQKYRPRVILACGALPFRHLTGLVGKKLQITNARGYVFACSRYPDILVIPTIHPSFVRRGNPHLASVLLFDFMKAVSLAQGKHIEYILDPLQPKTYGDMLRYHYLGSGIGTSTEQALLQEGIRLLEKIKADPSLTIAYDIETEKSIGVEEDELEEYGSNISQIQFSIGKNSGIAFPFIEPYVSIAKAILATGNDKVGWNNWLFDDPILRKAGMEINGRIDDLMWMWHTWQPDLPRGLQHAASYYNFLFPWKHLAGESLEFYGIADVDSLHYILPELKKQLESRGLYDSYDKYVFRLEKVLRKMQDRGLPINKVKQDEFREEIETRKDEIDIELREKIPEISKVSPTKGYIREPKEINSIRQRLMIQQMKVNIDEDEIGIEAAKIGLVKREFGFENELRWCREEGFNPNSSDQVSDYIKSKGDEDLARKLVLKIAKEDRNKSDEVKSKDNISTSKGVLKVLASKTGNKVYSTIVEYRELTKMKGFLWEPSNDGRVHSEFGFGTGSGQLTSKNPNIQQGPEHYELAEKFKETIEAGEDKILIKVDYRAYHAKMLGFLALDTDYMRLATIDPHSFVTAHMVNLPEAKECIGWEDIKLIDYLKKVKKDYKSIRDDQAKHAILGIGFGLSEKGCYDRYREDFNPKQDEVLKSWGTRKKNSPLDINGKTGSTYLQEEIEKRGRHRVSSLYQLLRKLFPKIFKYQEKILIEADKGWLDTAFGARRWFPAASEVKYDRYGNILSRTKGEQAEEALAFPVSNSAHYHLREGVIIADDIGILDRLGMINWVHDDLRFEADQESFKEDLMKLLTILERESKILVNELGGFSCKADVKIGKNLREMKEYII